MSKCCDYLFLTAVLMLHGISFKASQGIQLINNFIPFVTFKRHWDPTPQTKLWMVYLKQDITHKLTDKSLLGSKASITLYLMQLRIIKHKHDERLIKLMKYKSDFEKEGRNISIHEDILPYYMLCPYRSMH